MRKTAIVTGGSSGIGRAVALKLCEKGYKVYEFSRNGVSGSGIAHCTVDVTDEELVRSTVSSIVKRERKIDLVVNSAGFGISGACEFTDHHTALSQLEVNLLGTANVDRAVLPYMRRRGRGRIVNVSSVAGVMPLPFQVWYSVSKAGINSYTLGLANEVRPYGIEVCAVMFGDLRTGFTSARSRVTEGDDDYGGRISRSVGKTERDEQGGHAPDEAAEYILHILRKRRLPPLCTMGLPYKAAVLADRLITTKFKNFLLNKLYGGE
ncbi:MAG TPA: short-chain dehydrogenase [Ruminococcus sp.]|nr:short-chain dehydrogenase [Ruminococcus sp.]